jgi:hypothetical protein
MKYLNIYLKFIVYFIYFISSINAAAAGNKQKSVLFSLKNSTFPCRFPITGEFYIDDGPQRILKIDESHFETKGDCIRGSDKNKNKDFFVVRQKSETDTCYRCILFLTLHANVIRFKQSLCVRDDTDLEGLCRQIAGDSPLFTMFRTNPTPIACPIPMPSSFAYSISSGFCRNDGLSMIDECSVPNRFRLSFVSCPHATKSITHDEAYECIADWNHYSTYYFAARVVGNPFNPALGDFRCFIVDQTTNRIAMSADSSCLELTALDRASVVLTYSNAERPKPTCTFPHVIRGFAAWTSVSSGNTIKINKGRWTEISRDNETVVKALCVHSEDDLFVVKKTTGCNTGISCIKTQKHSPDVISVTSVPMAAADMELCKKLQASEKTTFSFDMLIKDDHVVKCPYEGLLFSEKCSKPLLSVGCDISTRMNLTDICSVRLPNSKTDIAITETFVCRSSFRVKNETFLIASSRRRFLCLKFWLKSHDSLVVDTYSDTACYNEALELSKRLPERFEIVQTAGCPSKAANLVKLLLPSPSSSSSFSLPMTSFCFLNFLFLFFIHF